MSSVSNILSVEWESPRRTPSLATRLTAWYAATAFLLVLLATSVLYWSLTRAIGEQNDQFLLSKVFVLQKLLSEKSVNDRLIQLEIAEDLGGPEPIYVQIRSRDGAVSFETPNISPELVSKGLARAHATGDDRASGSKFATSSGKKYWIMSIPNQSYGPSEAQFQIDLAMDIGDDESLLRHYESWLLPVLSISFVMAVVIGLQIARRGLAPLDRLTQIAGGIGVSNLNDRISLKGLPTEIRSLAVAFNNMMVRLQNSFGRLSQFSDDIAHELRTPLQNIMNVSEIALSKARGAEEYREFLESILENSGRLSRMVQSLMFLARADNPSAQIVREKLDVCREIERIKEFFDPAAAEAGVSISISCSAGLNASLDRTLLQRAISNLVSNAIAHTPSGGRIELQARPTSEGIRIAVADTGRGITAADLPHVFDRLYRANAARSDSDDHLGLGLSIVKGIAHLHGGDVTIDSEPNRGTCVTLSLPN